MINREDWIMIKQLHKRDCYQKDIAARLNISECTVRHALVMPHKYLQRWIQPVVAINGGTTVPLASA
jgi:hypothetical protein